MPALPRDLGDGLVLRAARPADGEQLVDLNGRLHAEPGEGPDLGIAEWTRDLLELSHPTFRLEDTTVVEDTTTNRVVSTVFPIPQTWTYAGVPIAVGRPELVATEAPYRRRGLVREQFAVLHEQGDAAGQHLQFITGIPWYYRQFGYDFALDLPTQPTLRLGTKPVEADPQWTLRPATPDDVAFLDDIDAAASLDRPWLRCRRDVALWQLELGRRPWGNPGNRVMVVEEVGAGAPRPSGYVIVQNLTWDGYRSVRAFELRPGVSWLGPTRSVVAFLQRDLADPAMRQADAPPPVGITFALPAAHPGLRSAATRAGAPMGSSYGLYVRIADLPRFIGAVAPALEARLTPSPAVGFTGDLRIDLYTEGLQLSFTQGALAAVTPWRPADDADQPDAALPRDAFVNLLLGNRTITQLEGLIADCEVNTDAGALLLDTLFPPMPLSTWVLS